MNKSTRALLACAAACACIALAPAALAHGIVGDRFFPPTIATDDPFAVDELALPTISWMRNPAGDGSPPFQEIDSVFEFDKEIFPHFAVGIADTFIYQRPYHAPTVTGWSNLTVTAKYELWQNAEHEAIIAAGVETDLGRTGNRNTSDPFTTVSPTFYFGKGFGDLPESVEFLQPFALTGTIAQSFPLSTGAPNTLDWGFAIEYSLPYLQQHVKDIGLPEPFKNMIPLVEFAMQTTENRGQGGLTSGTINPGVLYEHPYFQIGLEANIPVNHLSGAHVGVTLQAWIFIDSIWPRLFGHPIFGAQS